MVGLPHHVTQRGNSCQDVFRTHNDRKVYLEAFSDHAAQYGLRVWGYCLMTNHVHFVAVPEQENSLAKVFGRTHCDYARYANIVRRSGGHFWQARFYSCALDEPHAWRALAYVERNPVRAGLVAAAEDYPWSSAAAHCREDDMDERLELQPWKQRYAGERWREVLRVGIEEEALRERIRTATHRGRPLGDEAFVESVGRALGRDLRWRRPGRPAKAQESGAG